MKVGILFGGRSREREISFAGGRTVYDCLDKNLFEPVPLFIDSFGQLIHLNWHFLYKGSIRDFYPPLSFQEKDQYGFQVYQENITSPESDRCRKMAAEVGSLVKYEELPNLIDFAFLTLHGPYGEDGTIQGILQYHNIPFTSAGIFPSAFGMDKSLQKKWMPGLGFNAPEGLSVTRHEWENANSKELLNRLKSKPGLPFVIKSATQGSSIGVSILKNDDIEEFTRKVDKSFFRETISREEWQNKNQRQRLRKVQQISDLDAGIGLPVTTNDNQLIRHPGELFRYIEKHFENSGKNITLQSLQSESRVVFESMIHGREFSCIVIQQENGNPLALPPTEIRKKSDLFDYRAKYLPGISSKITPIDLPIEDTERIRSECTRLFDAMRCNVYARIDGFINNDGKIFLNDPNTTSGMLPSSFFFHQAAEIGLNPTQYLTYIIHQSLIEREKEFPYPQKAAGFIAHLQKKIGQKAGETSQKLKVAVILGGYSSERHISVESGRNVVEKLSASTRYEPFPVFLTKENGNINLHKIPVNLLLKDNADDITNKIQKFSIHPISEKIINEAGKITQKFGDKDYDFYPEKLSIQDLKDRADLVFLGLHGRPGEDGTLQQELEKHGIPYNGSPPESAGLTIDKYATNKLLQEKGFLTATGILIKKEEWQQESADVLEKIKQQTGFPCIAKPSDDGCSSAVKKIDTEEAFKAYAEASFRNPGEEISDQHREQLGIDSTEPFPEREYFMIESLISAENADHFLEVTGGMLTHHGQDGAIEYEIFEPSEALAEAGILSLEEKFLAGEGQNITPARFSEDPETNQYISGKVREKFQEIAKTLKVEGYCRIDAFVRIKGKEPEVIFIELNSLPGLTPATVIFHQAAINGYKPVDFLNTIIEYGLNKKNNSEAFKISNK